jgi:hypothetical protein
MAIMHEGLIQCPKCKLCGDDKRYTPVGLAQHWADVHPVKLQVLTADKQLENPCPMGSGLSCLNCFFAAETRCRFDDLKNRIGD